MSERKKVLIVDDLEVNRAILAQIFMEDYDIIEAEDGIKAIEMIEEYGNSIIVVLLDVIMPNLDGFGVMDYMKANGYEGNIPVILITADNSAQTEERGYESKVSDIITKPFKVSVVKRRVQNVIDLYEYQKNLELTVEEQMEALEKQYYDLSVKNQELVEYEECITEALSNMLEFRSNDDGGHIKRIKNYTYVLLKCIMKEYPEEGITYENMELIVKASAMHDIGKIAISDSIVLKPGKLTEDEFEIMKTHTILGCDTIEGFSFIKNKEFYNYIYDICRHHHERIDGSGYPDGLKGDEISIAAQVVSISDVYDALVSKRCYKSAYAHDDAVRMILGGECGVFSEKLLHCFELCGNEIKEIFMAFSKLK